MDLILTFSEPAIENAIHRLVRAEEVRTCRPAAAIRQQMREAVKMVADCGYAAVERKQQDLALAVFLAAAVDDISAVN